MSDLKIDIINEIKEEHFNPQFARDKIQSLDGVWKCNGTTIRVPFAPESDLAEFSKRNEVLSKNWDGKLVYETEFTISKNFDLPRVLLHFGAVDQIAQIYINEKYVGEHEGGYLAFSFDISEVLKVGTNILRVEVTDTLSTKYPYGKQKKNRGGMWYTPVSGIWKSVWLENVSDIYVKSFTVKSNLEGTNFIITTSDGKKLEKRIDVENPHFWTNDDPYLYPIKVTYEDDIFYSYFAIRTISIQNIDGINRVCLNNKPIFMHGVLDQGYWPDGIYTPRTPKLYEDDILSMKELGLNMLRKHIKVESAYFYYACDKLGMLVCQDMVENGRYHYFRDTIFPYFGIMRKDYILKNLKKHEIERREFFIQHCKDTVAEVYNHPCVIMYTIFNEGWGQFESDRLYDIMKNTDPDRLWDSTSGWFKHKKNDFDTAHIYYRNERVIPKIRPMFIKECGGYSLKVANHVWNEKHAYGYGTCKTVDELTAKIEKMYEKMVYPAIEEGLCGCIYTQLSDVEDEINGLYTYDRNVCKVDKLRLQKISEQIVRFIGQ